MNAEMAPQVLRDVVVRGHRVPGRHSSSRGSSRATNGPAPDAAPRPGGRNDPAPESALATPRSDARLPADQIAQEAYRRGCEEGAAAARDEAMRSAAQTIEREVALRLERLQQEMTRKADKAYQEHVHARTQALEALIAGLPRQIEARVDAVEDELAAACFEVLCRILGEQAARPEAVRAQVANALAALQGRRVTAIRVHPGDLRALETLGVTTARPGQAEVRWIGDSAVELGGCILETPEGGLDARVESQLAALREALLTARSTEAPPS
jgi:flagellar assembly protein FliH